MDSDGRWGARPKQLQDIESLRSRVAYGGLDLSAKFDLNAWAIVFPPCATDPNYVALVWYFVPEENVRARETRYHVRPVAREKSGCAIYV